MRTEVRRDEAALEHGRHSSMDDSARKVRARDTHEMEPPWWKAPCQFLHEVICALLIFGLIAIAAIGIDLAVQLLRQYGTDSVIIYGLKGLEYVIFATDLILFGRFLYVRSRRLWRAL
jgi:hypothetical protein